ncbi:hypothetical protein JA1_001073 [Spathaspora sp. JA1]|nr:hypothetical protein JA1_001073 [Spathaspora sp. JA1]
MIYCNVGSSPFQITANLHTSFYTKFTVINGREFLPWLNENPNICLIKKIVFNSAGITPDTALSLFPWIDVAIELETYSTSHCSKNQLASRSSNLIFTNITAIPPLYTLQEWPWVTKAVISLMRVERENLLAVKKLCRLRELEVYCYRSGILQNLESIGLKHLPIKSLFIGFSGDIGEIQIDKIKNIFNLETITAFQLSLWCPQYPGYLENHVTLVSKNFKFEEIIRRLKPNSLHSLYLKIIQSGNVVRTFQVEDMC